MHHSDMMMQDGECTSFMHIAACVQNKVVAHNSVNINAMMVTSI